MKTDDQEGRVCPMCRQAAPSEERHLVPEPLASEELDKIVADLEGTGTYIPHHNVDPNGRRYVYKRSCEGDPIYHNETYALVWYRVRKGGLFSDNCLVEFDARPVWSGYKLVEGPDRVNDGKTIKLIVPESGTVKARVLNYDENGAEVGDVFGIDCHYNRDSWNWDRSYKKVGADHGNPEDADIEIVVGDFHVTRIGEVDGEPVVYGTVSLTIEGMH